MQIIPAIDIKEGRCVRLKQGNFDHETVFSDDPVAVAEKWLEQGAKRIHLVDLDGALKGTPINNRIIGSIVRLCGEIPVQVGGGIRDLDTLSSYLDSGVAYTIIGTKAINSPDFVESACMKFQDKIIAGLDSKNNKLALDGWSNDSGMDLHEVAKHLQQLGVCSIIFTDISKDGMLEGPNIEEISKLAQTLAISVIASGGVKNIEDIKALAKISHLGIPAVIVGRAIYEGTLDLKDANEVLKKIMETPDELI